MHRCWKLWKMKKRIGGFRDTCTCVYSDRIRSENELLNLLCGAEGSCPPKISPALVLLTSQQFVSPSLLTSSSLALSGCVVLILECYFWIAAHIVKRSPFSTIKKPDQKVRKHNQQKGPTLIGMARCDGQRNCNFKLCCPFLFGHPVVQSIVFFFASIVPPVGHQVRNCFRSVSELQD